MIRRTTLEDLAQAHVPWLKPDGWRPNGHSFVELAGDQIVGAAMRCPNRVHPTREIAWLQLPRTGPSGLLDALVDVGGLPMSIKTRPCSREQAAVLSVGGIRYQHCPAELVSTGSESLQAWCEANHNAPVESASGWTNENLNDAWTRLYEVVHASWSPTAERSALLAEFGPMIAEELNTERSTLSLIEGGLVAACFVFGTSNDTELEAITEALVPKHPGARRAVAACMAKVLEEAAGVPVMFDGHLSDPHFYPLLQTLPEVQANELAPLDLLEISSRSPLSTGSERGPSH